MGRALHPSATAKAPPFGDVGWMWRPFDAEFPVFRGPIRGVPFGEVAVRIHKVDRTTVGRRRAEVGSLRAAGGSTDPFSQVFGSLGLSRLSGRQE